MRGHQKLFDAIGVKYNSMKMADASLIADPRADLEGAAPGARPPYIFSKYDFFITILYK